MGPVVNSYLIEVTFFIKQKASISDVTKTLRQTSSLEDVQKKAKQTSEKDKIRNCISKRFISSHGQIRLKKPVKRPLKVCRANGPHSTVQGIHRSKQSILEASPISSTREHLNEGSDALFVRKSRLGIKHERKNKLNDVIFEKNETNSHKWNGQVYSFLSTTMGSTSKSNDKASKSKKESLYSTVHASHEASKLNIEKSQPLKITSTNSEESSQSNQKSTEWCNVNKRVNKLRSKVKGGFELLPQKAEKQLELKKENFKKEEKGLNTNANSGDADNMKNSLDKENARKVIFRREAINFPVQRDRQDNESTDTKKENSFSKEKVHPAVSKKTNRLKSDKNLDAKILSPDDDYREKDSYKKIRQDKRIVKERLVSENAWGSSTNLTENFDEDVGLSENPGKLDIHIEITDKDQSICEKPRPSPVGSESGSMEARYMIPTNSDNSSAEDLSEDPSLEEIKNISKSLVLKSTNIALDIVQGYSSVDGNSKEHSKYKSKLAYIAEEKEPPEEKQKKLLKKIYDEIHVEHKPPTYPSHEKRKSPILTETNDAAVYEYETTDDEADVPQPQLIKKNTVIIPKPRPKQTLKEVEKETMKTEKDLRVSVQEEKSPRENSEPMRETYSTMDLINDIDICLADMHNRPSPPKPRDTTLPPNPFPVCKDNLPDVCPPTTEKPKHRRKKTDHKPKQDVSDIDIQNTTDASQLGRLREVRNRTENTPEIFLQTGKQQAKSEDSNSVKYKNPLRVYQRPIGKLQPKGRDSTSVDVDFYTHGENTSTYDQKNEKNGHPSSSSVSDNLTPSQKKHYAKVQSTFRAREEDLPDAKFWTDIAQGNIPNRKQVTIETSTNTNKPVVPIGYGGLQEFDLGISSSEAELNRQFFSKVVSRPEFSKKKKSPERTSSTDPINNIKGQNQEATADSNNFFPNMTTNLEPQSNSTVQREDYQDKPVANNSVIKTSSPPIHVVDSQENLKFFKTFSKTPDLFEKRDNEVILPRSYFNEPPLGVEELPGRHHTKGSSNLNFFLSVSRNASHFFTEPSNKLEKEEVISLPPPESFQQNSGFIPYDPGNYVDEGTASDNLEFFKKIGKGDIEKDKKQVKSEVKKKKKKVSVLEPEKISREKAQENMQFFRDMARQKVRHD